MHIYFTNFSFFLSLSLALCVCVYFPNVLHNFSKEQICMSNRTRREKKPAVFFFYKHHTEKKRLDISFSGAVSKRLCCCLDTYRVFFFFFQLDILAPSWKVPHIAQRRRLVGIHSCCGGCAEAAKTRKSYMFRLRNKDRELWQHVILCSHDCVLCMLAYVVCALTDGRCPCMNRTCLRSLKLLSTVILLPSLSFTWTPALRAFLRPSFGLSHRKHITLPASLTRTLFLLHSLPCERKD